MNRLYEQKAERAGKSFALIGERCVHSANAPYGIRKAEDINADDVLVLALPGTHTQQDAVYVCNAFLKKIVEQIGGQHECRGLKFCVAIDGAGEYFSAKEALFCLRKKVSDPEAYQKFLAQLCAEKKAEYEMPQAVKDIFATIFAPRLEKIGNAEQAKLLIAQRLQKVIIIAYCYGFYWTLRLEELLSKSLLKLGFDEKEIAELQKNMQVMVFAPNVNVMLAKSNVTAVVSAADIASSWKSAVVEYTHRHIYVEAFGYCCESYKHKHIFYCDCYCYHKMEKVLRCVPVKAWKDLIPKRKKSMGEHSFLGFSPTAEMSEAAVVVQKMLKNILFKTIEMRLHNRYDNISSAWYYTQKSEWCLYQRACLKWRSICVKAWFWKKVLCRRSFVSSLQVATLD